MRCASRSAPTSTRPSSTTAGHCSSTLSHRGAHEYLGELQLMRGNLEAAQQSLAALDKLCTLPCEEFTDLKKAIERYRAQLPK